MWGSSAKLYIIVGLALNAGEKIMVAVLKALLMSMININISISKNISVKLTDLILWLTAFSFQL